MARKCSICGQTGHNKQTCPTYSRDDVSRRQRAKEKEKRKFDRAGVNIDDYYTYDGRLKRRRKPPTCSTCKQIGHTKRKCPGIFKDRNNVVVKLGDLIQFSSFEVALVLSIGIEKYQYCPDELQIKVITLDNTWYHSPFKPLEKIPDWLRESFGKVKTISSTQFQQGVEVLDENSRAWKCLYSNTPEYKEKKN